MATRTIATRNVISIAQGLVDAVAFSLAISAFAFAGPTQTPQSFESLDRNTDQRLSRSEASYDRRLSDIFAASDLDGDGFVSRAEYAWATSGQRQETSASIRQGID